MARTMGLCPHLPVQVTTSGAPPTSIPDEMMKLMTHILTNQLNQGTAASAGGNVGGTIDDEAQLVVRGPGLLGRGAEETSKETKSTRKCAYV